MSRKDDRVIFAMFPSDALMLLIGDRQHIQHVKILLQVSPVDSVMGYAAQHDVTPDKKSSYRKTVHL